MNLVTLYLKHQAHCAMRCILTISFFLGLGIAVVVYRKLRNERLFYVDIRVRKERASLFFYGSSSKNFDFTCL